MGKQLPVISPQPNYWLTVSSLAIVLLLGVIPFFLGLEVPKLVKYIQDNSYIGVSFLQEPSQSQRDSLDKILGKFTQVQQPGQWIDGETAWSSVREDFPEMAQNPLVTMFLFRLKEGWDDLAFQHQMTERIRKLTVVDQVYVPPVRFDQIKQNVRTISISLGLLSLLALAGAALLIYFTIRLSIYDKRFSIRTLELVGADWAFIQRPFVKRGLRIGMISAILASLVLAAMVFLWSSQNEVVSRYLDWSGLLWSLALINILGPFVGLITSLFTVNRYLQGGIDELFNT